MYKYQLSVGEYSDYCDSPIYHDTHFTSKEFLEMYNEIINKVVAQNNIHSFYMGDKIAEAMCETFGFKQLEVTCGIHAGYNEFKKVPTDHCEKYNCSIVDMDDIED